MREKIGRLMWWEKVGNWDEKKKEDMHGWERILRWEKQGDKRGWGKGKLRWKKKKKKIEVGEIEREREFEIKKNRKIDVVRESGKLRWEKKGRHVWWERNIDMREKKRDRHGWERGN